MCPVPSAFARTSHANIILVGKIPVENRCFIVVQYNMRHIKTRSSLVVDHLLYKLMHNTFRKQSFTFSRIAQFNFPVVPENLFEKAVENIAAFREKYTSGPRYWNVPVLVNTGTFCVYQYCPKLWSLCSLEHGSVIQKLTILEHKNGLVLSNTHVPVSGTWSILFPAFK